MAIAGRVAIVPKGDWSANAAYKRLDAVTYNNTLYFAKKEVPAGTATSNTEYWSKSIVGGVGAIATTEEAGIVKPADGLTVAEDGTLKVNIDGATLTMDQVNNVIKLADTLKEKINGAFPAANVVNNQITTETGYALDARQANPNIDGSLAKKISDLNGSIDTKVNALNPSYARRSYVYGGIGKEGDGWYRFARITFRTESYAEGAGSELIEVMINQSYTNSPGCFHKVDFYLKYLDSAIISTIGNNSTVLKKIRMVRNNKTIFIDVYSVGIVNGTKMLLYIPSDFGIDSVECITPYLVPENSDGELIVCSSDLANSI
jgi:hypothetical protein